MDYPLHEPFITATMKVDELAELDIEVIALDCTQRERYDGLKSRLFRSKKISNQLLTIDTSTLKRDSSSEAGIDLLEQLIESTLIVRSRWTRL